MKKNVSLLLCAALVFSFCAALLSGCTPATPETPDVSRDVSFYSLDIAEQPYLTTDLSSRGDGALQDVFLCLSRNEHEFAQIVVRPKHDLASVKMEISDLKDAQGSVLDADVTLYRAHYVQYHGDGVFRPTALIPLFDGSDGAMATDTVGVKAGENQAFYLELYSNSATKPGTYTGTVTFTYDGTAESADVSVTVWDFELPAASSLKTAYGFWPWMTRDWYAAWHPDIEYDLDEVSNKQRDFLRQYRLSVEMNSGSYATLDDWAAEIRREVDAGVLTMTAFPLWYGDNWTREYYVESNKARLDAIEKYDLFDYVWFYVVDEPYWQEAYDKANHIAEVLNYIDPRLKQMVTTYYQSGRIEDIEIWCPTEEHITRDSVNEAHARSQKIWTYGIREFSEENDVYDRYHLWTMESLHVDGYLLWLVNLFLQFEIHGAESESFYVARDIWQDGATWGFDNGQAILFYPCVAEDGMVGRDMEIPTVDLFVECTGLEDYEYFTILRNQYADLIDSLGIDVDIDDVMNTYYAPVTSGLDMAVSSSDVTLGDRIRAYASDDILNADKAVVTVERRRTSDGEEAVLNVFAKHGAEVKDANGNVLTPVRTEGNADVYEVRYLNYTGEVSVTVNGKTIRRLVSSLRDYDVSLDTVDKIRENARILGIDDTSAFETELYDSTMKDSFTLRSETESKTYVHNMLACETPVLHRTYDYLNLQDKLKSRTLNVYVPKGCTVSANGNEMTLVETTDLCDVYETLIRCDALMTLVPLTLNDNGQITETTVLVMQHMTNGQVVLYPSYEPLKTAVESVNGLTLTEDGLRIDFDDDVSLVRIKSDGLSASDLRENTVLRFVIENPTDNDEVGFSYTVGLGFSKTDVTPAIPAHSTVTVDVNIGVIAKDKRSALKSLSFMKNPEEPSGVYVIRSISAFDVQ